MSQTGQISMRVVRTLADAVAEVGVPRARLLRAVHLEESCLQSLDERLPITKLYELLEQALDLTADPAFGLHSIERMSMDALNPLAGLVAHATSVRQAFRSIDDFRRILGDDATFRWHEDNGKVHLLCRSPLEQPLRVQRYLAEVALAGLYRKLRELHATEHVELVSFAYAAPEYASEYVRSFEGRVRFGQAATGMELSAALFKAVPTYADAELHEALSVLASRRALHLADRAPYAARVHDALVWQRPPRDLTMRAVARKLGVSVRSLRRYLLAEGKTFSTLVVEAQACLAKRAVLNGHRSIAEIAHELGFADPTSFHRAFRRWTGTTPNGFRRQTTQSVQP